MSLERGGEAACRIKMRGRTYRQRPKLTLTRATWSRHSAGRVIKYIELMESNTVIKTLMILGLVCPCLPIDNYSYLHDQCAN